jgi:hypothetical protein
VSTRERRRRQSSTRRKIVWALVLALVFAVGIALGEALHDNPKPGSTTTVTVTTP